MAEEKVVADRELDVRGAQCPLPIIRARQEINQLSVGQILKVLATDPGSVNDFKGWARTARNIELVKQEEIPEPGNKRLFVHYIKRIA